MNKITPTSKEPTNKGASTSTEKTVINKSTKIRNKKCKIGKQNINVEHDAVIHITNHEETTKTFPFKYHIKDAENSFRGRDDELTCLKSHLLSDDVNKTKSRMAVIAGLPGIGKTELARKFVSMYENDFNRNILWINAESPDNLKESFVSIATSLKIDNVQKNDIRTIVDNVYSYFENNSCLFVFDNAEKIEDIENYLPSKSVHSTVKYSILITSTKKIWGNNFSVVTLNELLLDSAVDVAKAIIGEANCDSNTLPMNTIVEFVDKIPLGIQIISHLILYEILEATEIEAIFSFTEFFKTLKDEKILDTKVSEYSVNSYNKSIFAAIKLAIKKIENFCSKSGATEALDVLHGSVFESR